MSQSQNNRETGARKYPAKVDADAQDGFSNDAAANAKPVGGIGLTDSGDYVNEKTRHSDGQNPRRQPTPSPATEKASGAGPAIAERSKDVKAPKPGRQPGAYVKD